MKEKRQMKILDVIEEHKVETQEELAALLHNEGIDVTQATVSRDIKELQLIKVPDEDGGYCYARPQERSPGDLKSRARRLFKDAIVNIDHTNNLMVIKTLPGYAQSVCELLDNINWGEIMGTIAGEDTILVIIRNAGDVGEILDRFTRLMR